MISGSVADDLLARISVQVSSPASDEEAIVNAIVDTGFNGYLMLPKSAVRDLELKQQGIRPAILADGKLGSAKVYRANVQWDGEVRNVQVVATEVDPLVGTSLLRGFKLTVDIVKAGAIQIEKLDA